MLNQISKEGVQTRLTDPSLFVFRTIDKGEDSKCVMRFEVYPIGQFGTPDEIMKAMENENNFLFEEREKVEFPRLNLL